MRFTSLLVLGASAVGARAGLFATDASQPDIEIKAIWPQSNQMSHVYNGRDNHVSILMTNHDKRSWELQQISGSFRQLGGVERFLRNTTTQRFSLVLPPTSLQPMHVPYKFNSEQRTGEVLLHLYADFKGDDGVVRRLPAYEGQVTVREPKGSWFDPQLLFLYIILGGVGVYAAYGLFTLFFPTSTKATNKRRGAKKPSTVHPASPVKTSQPASDLSDFLPQSMQSSGLKGRKSALDVSITSEGESGAESAASAGGTRRRSTRKQR